MPRIIRDQKLLDTLESVEQRPYASVVWRSVREGRDPLICWRSGARWDDSTFDVLYTSESREAAIEERRFHLYEGQPFPPSLVGYELYELQVSLKTVISFAGIEELEALGFESGLYGQLAYNERTREYPRLQDIAEACFFLGADGILVPSARHTTSRNLVVFCEQDPRPAKEVLKAHGRIDWRAA